MTIEQGSQLNQQAVDADMPPATEMELPTVVAEQAEPSLLERSRVASGNILKGMLVNPVGVLREAGHLF